ncbi:hypothetical protein ACWGJB_44795 [Streptomyces sp. NPDC054813]
MRGHYGGSPESVTEPVRLAEVGRLDLAPSITDHIPLAEAADAVNRLEKRSVTRSASSSSPDN